MSLQPEWRMSEGEQGQLDKKKHPHIELHLPEPRVEELSGLKRRREQPDITALSDRPQKQLKMMPQPSANRPIPLMNGARKIGSLSQSAPTGTSVGSNVKKLNVKLKEPPKLPANFFEESWIKLDLAVRAIHEKKPVQFTMEELYRSVDDLVDHKLSENLYRKLESLCEEHAKYLLKVLLEQMQSTTLEQFLILVNTCWSDYCQQQILIRSIFLSLDRKYILPNHTSSSQTVHVSHNTSFGSSSTSLSQSSSASASTSTSLSQSSPSIGLNGFSPTPIRALWDMGLFHFSTYIISNTHISSHLLQGLLRTIENDRKGESTDKTLVRTLIRMLCALHLYSNYFEPPFLSATEKFYTEEAERHLQEYPVNKYLLHFEKRLEEENQRVLTYLDTMTRKALIHALERIALQNHVTPLIEKGFDGIVDEDRVDDLRRMYSLFARVDSLKLLKTAWNAHIKKRGEALIRDQERDNTMIDQLLKYKGRMDVIFANAFNSDGEFAYSLKEGFEHFINVRDNAVAQHLARFIDAQMRGGKTLADASSASTTASSSSILSETELETLLDKVMQLFRYISAKDVFDAFYKRDLAKRLLLGKSISIDTERGMITRLKTECGANFTTKMEGMFKDVDLSAELMESFRTGLATFGFESKVFILTTGYWPNYPPCKLILPRELGQFQETFEGLYLSKYPGRRLMWQPSLGHCTLKALFPRGRKELSVSLFQTVVLLLFNDMDQRQDLSKRGSLTYKEILTFSGAQDEAELKKTLQSLACGKVHLLNKSPQGRDINPTDAFTFNAGFVCRPFRLRINQVQLVENASDQKKTEEGVFKDRQYQVDAAIVRIMKTRKRLTHNALLTDLFNILKFTAKPYDIKKRIESLIEREYLERDKQDNNVYNYLA